MTGNINCCYDFTWSDEYKRGEKQKPEDCPGVLATTSADGFTEEGYYIQVCPRRAWLGRAAGGIVFCGNGPDVIVLHQSTIPSIEEYEKAAKEADNDW